MIIEWNFWIYHGKSEINRCSINSLDFNPFQNVLATAGKDSLIKIWNFDKIQNFFKKRKKETLFYSMNFCNIIENDGVQINIIRWSPNGKFLAVGADDGKLVIYFKNSFLRNQKTHFKIFHKFKNSQNDILSLNWSPDSNFVSATGYSNNVTIFSIKKKYVFAKITSKVFLIRGSYWDPLGNFFVTQSYSQGIKIWDVLKWKLVKTIEFFLKQFSNVKFSQKLMVKTPFWTACGNYVIFNDCIKIGDNFCLKVIDRYEKFSKYKIFFKGRSQVNIIRGSPRIYIKKILSKISSIISIITNDGKLYIWAPDFSKIILSIKNLCKKSFTDVTWKHDGYGIYASTSTGEIISIVFNYIEIGKTLNIQQHTNFLVLSKKKLVYLNQPINQQNSDKKIPTSPNFDFIQKYSIRKIKKNMSNSVDFYKKILIFGKTYGTLPPKKKLTSKILEFKKTERKNKCFYKEQNKSTRNQSLLTKRYFIVYRTNYSYVVFSNYGYPGTRRIEVLTTRPFIRCLENKNVIVMIYANKKTFEIVSVLKYNYKKNILSSFCQIKQIVLRKNLLILMTTTEYIEIWKTSRLERIFIFNISKTNILPLTYTLKIYLQSIIKCSGLLIFC